MEFWCTDVTKFPEVCHLKPGSALNLGPTAPTTAALSPLDPQPEGAETNLSNGSKDEKCWKIPGFIERKYISRPWGTSFLRFTHFQGFVEPW